MTKFRYITNPELCGLTHDQALALRSAGLSLWNAPRPLTPSVSVRETIASTPELVGVEPSWESLRWVCTGQFCALTHVEDTDTIYGTPERRMQADDAVRVVYLSRVEHAARVVRREWVTKFGREYADEYMALYLADGMLSEMADVVDVPWKEEWTTWPI